MSETHYPWSFLEIPATSERRDIKRAYAKKLKAIDVDNDPKAFMDLRAAHDRALQELEWRQYDAVGEGDENADDSVFTSDERGIRITPVYRPDGEIWHQSPAEPEPPREPTAEELAREELETLKREVDAAVFTNRKDARKTDEELAALMRQILESDANQNISLSGYTELWAAEIVNDGGARANPLIPVLSEHYGWSKRDMYSGDYTLDDARDRATDYAALQRANQPGHKYYKTLQKFLNPPASTSVFAMLRDAIFGRKGVKLLREMRRDYPTMEYNDFDRDSVAYWDKVSEIRREIPGILWQMILGAPIVAYLVCYFILGTDSIPIYLINLGICIAGILFFAFADLSTAPDRSGKWDEKTGRHKSYRADIPCYAIVGILPIVAALLPVNIYSTAALLFVAAILRYLLRIEPDNYIEESFILRWLDRVLPLMVVALALNALIKLGYTARFDNLVLAAALMAWTMVRHKRYWNELMRQVPVKTRIHLCMATLAAAIFLFMGSAYFLSGKIGLGGGESYGLVSLLIDFMIAQYNVAGTGEIVLLLSFAVLMCAAYAACILDVRPPVRDRVIWYFGYIAAIIAIIAFAPFCVTMMIVYRMADSINRLRKPAPYY